MDLATIPPIIDFATTAPSTNPATTSPSIGFATTASSTDPVTTAPSMDPVTTAPSADTTTTTTSTNPAATTAPSIDPFTTAPSADTTTTTSTNPAATTAPSMEPVTTAPSADSDTSSAPTNSPATTQNPPSQSPPASSSPSRPAPAPSPTTTTTTVVLKIASFDTALDMTDVTKFDVEKFKESVSISQGGLDTEEVEVGSVSYEVKVQYSFPDEMGETDVRNTIAEAQNVPSNTVFVARTPARRLGASQRRLEASWDVTIKTDDATAVDAIATKATDVSAVKEAAEKLGVEEVTVKVATPPKKKVSVQFKVRSKPNAVDVLQDIDAGKLAENLGASLGVQVEVGPVVFKGVEEEVKSPPTQAPKEPTTTAAVATTGTHVSPTEGSSTEGSSTTALPDEPDDIEDKDKKSDSKRVMSCPRFLCFAIAWHGVCQLTGF
eukprot:TRINITY_DN9534_c0_g1_i1.p1 TRINITY_DN9534_c0_g1~~TRINITY_DN9534_c0_g1_i1.p1  ORF type:complete len:492 (+),score=94.68 TRINITY_DN9534_c0_g1_i1:171-1478(+)